MPLCAGCGSSYSDDFRFCPHCGCARPEPVRVRVEVHSAPTQFEEGVLRLVYTGKSEEQLVDRGKRGMFGVGWTDVQLKVLFFVLDLEVIHPSKQHDVGLISDPFRGVFDRYSDDVLRTLESECEYHNHTCKWYDECREEPKNIWSRFNDCLISDGWNGITDEALERRLPHFLTHGLVKAIASANVFTQAELSSYHVPNASNAVEIGKYRYRRVVTS